MSLRSSQHCAALRVGSEILNDTRVNFVHRGHHRTKMKEDTQKLACPCFRTGTRFTSMGTSLPWYLCCQDYLTALAIGTETSQHVLGLCTENPRLRESKSARYVYSEPIHAQKSMTVLLSLP